MKSALPRWSCLIHRILLLVCVISPVLCHIDGNRCILTQSDVIHHVRDNGLRDQCGCPSSFISCAGRCYQRLSTKANHTQARKLCRLLHPKAHLAVPRSRQDNLCVAGLAGNKDIWLGITDTQQEGVFVGDDDLGVVDVPGTGHRWSPGQPDDAGRNEDCVEMWLGHSFADWNDRPCGSMRNLPMCQLGD